jgi:oligoribonuclease (3'-5' exoribonuclease)
MTNNGLLEVEVKELGQNLRFSLIDISNIEDCAKRYNGVLWTYIRRPQTAKIMLHQDVKEKVAFV